MSRLGKGSPLESWGRFPSVEQGEMPLHWRHEVSLPSEGTVLPYGLGRSYGDSCLNENGTLLKTRGLDRFIEFDRQSGVIRCEAGVSLAEILRYVVPQGWFLPVSPGTKFVTLGGAIANDVHGKNHHRAGTFGRHVTRFELLRSDGQRKICSPTENPEWFRATIGGLGLTGLITWAEFRLKPVANPMIRQQSIRYRDLDEFFDLSLESEPTHDYIVSWVDCLASGTGLGRGLFVRGNSAPPLLSEPLPPARSLQIAFPFDAPSFLLNPLSIGAFNWLYYNKQRRRVVDALVHFDPFFYPLDSIHHWNRMYGKRGFLQWQCVVPFSSKGQGAGFDSPVQDVLRVVASSGLASFLSVLKTTGDLESPGMMSFPKRGVTLALDFANSGPELLQMLDELDAIVVSNGGALYPAKDARMSADTFQTIFPQWKEFQAYVDPRYSSSFWRRVTQKGELR